MKRKILFLMPAMLNGGAEKVLIDILHNFDYSRYDVTLLLECKDGPYINDIPANVKVIAFHNKNIWIERLVRHLILFHCRWVVDLFLYKLPLLWYMRGLHFDTIISFMEGLGVKMHSYIYNKAHRNISWVHIDLKKKHWSLESFKSELEEQEAYRKMDKIVFVSQDAKRSFKELFNINDSKLEVLYNIIDSSTIIHLANSMHIDKKKFIICMVGRLNAQKRYDRALKVMKLLKEAGYEFELWILGSGELEGELKEMTAYYSIADIVKFKGFVKPAYAYMNVADIFLNTSDSEGYPVTLCEALCLGLPIVATDVTGSHELLSDSNAGILVNEDVDSIYKGLIYMIDNEVVRKQYSINAVEYAKTFSVGETMKQIYRIID